MLLMGWKCSGARLNQTYNMVNNYVNRSGATAACLTDSICF